ncbi:MAG: response regulator transcription factor [Alistipes sp.]|nr:response regulator transcription factor [Alistipes sp.]
MKIKRVIIVEDETAAVVNLRSMLLNIDPNIEIIATLESVEEAVDFFSSKVEADIVFMDIHLADGDSFRIFRSVDIDIPIIFTTAYDQYALQAFKVNSIDYLLKPFQEEELRHSLEKLERLKTNEPTEVVTPTPLIQHNVVTNNLLQTMLVRYKDRIIPISMEEVAYFYTFSERVTLTTHDGVTYPVDKTLESLSQQLSSKLFFRANRQFIVSRRAVKDVSVWFGSRLSLNLHIEAPERIVIPKARVAEFKQWLSQAQ